MPAVLSKEAELKDQVNALKKSVSDLDQQRGALSKRLAEAQKIARRVDELESALEQARVDVANAQAQARQAKAESASLQAQALKAAEVLAVAKGLKSLIASV